MLMGFKIWNFSTSNFPKDKQIRQQRQAFSIEASSEKGIEKLKYYLSLEGMANIAHKVTLFHHDFKF